MGRESQNTMLPASSDEKRERWERQQDSTSCFFCLDSNDADDWKMIFRLKGSVIPKSVLFSLPSAIAAVILHIYLRMVEPSMGEDLQDGSTQMWSSFMFVLGVLIVFRTNQAYSRYWEGATLLLQVRGEWFNAASSIVSFCSSDPARGHEVKRFQHQMVRFLSLLFCTGLQQVAFISDELLDIIDISGMDYDSLDFLSQCSDRSEVIIQWIQRSIILAMEKGIVSAPAPVLSRVFQELSRGSVNMQNVRKIAEIPFPFPYTQMIMVMLIVQTLLMPFVAAVTSATAWWAGILTFISVLAFWSLNYIAAEIEQPFGEDFNDLPIQNLMKDMNKSLRMLLLDFVLIPPEYELVDSDANCDVVNAADAGFGRGERRVVAGFAKRRTCVGHASTGTGASVVSHVTSFAPDRMDFNAMRNLSPRLDRGQSRTGMATVMSGSTSLEEGRPQETASPTVSWNLRGARNLQAHRPSPPRTGTRSPGMMSPQATSVGVGMDNLTFKGMDWSQEPETPVGQNRLGQPWRGRGSSKERVANRMAGGARGSVEGNRKSNNNTNHSNSNSNSVNNHLSKSQTFESGGSQTQMIVLDSENSFTAKLGSTGQQGGIRRNGANAHSGAVATPPNLPSPSRSPKHQNGDFSNSSGLDDARPCFHAT